MKAGRKIKNIDIYLQDTDTRAILVNLKKKGSVTINGLGTFKIVFIKPRTLYHNTAKKIITTAGHYKLKYTPTNTLKFFVNENE